MRRLLLITVLAAACGGDSRQTVDAKVDAPPDGVGSGSNVAAIEPSPPDHGLELIVVVASMVVVVGPASRRRRTNDDARRT